MIQKIYHFSHFCPLFPQYTRFLFTLQRVPYMGPEPLHDSQSCQMGVQAVVPVGILVGKQLWDRIFRMLTKCRPQQKQMMRKGGEGGQRLIDIPDETARRYTRDAWAIRQSPRVRLPDLCP